MSEDTKPQAQKDANKGPNSHAWTNLDVIATSTRELQVALEEDTFTTRAHELALQLDELDEIEARHQTLKQEMKAEVGQATKELKRLRGIVTSRSEPRPVLCEDRADYATATVYTVRTDTEALVSSRKMTADERQVGMDDIIAIESARRAQVQDDEIRASLRAAYDALKAGKLPIAQDLLADLLEEHGDDSRVLELRKRVADFLNDHGQPDGDPTKPVVEFKKPKTGQDAASNDDSLDD